MKTNCEMSQLLTDLEINFDADGEHELFTARKAEVG